MLPILIFLLALTACWAFASRDLEEGGGAAEETAPSGGSSCSDVCYGDAPRRQPPVEKRHRLTALNLAETIFEKEQAIGASREAAADRLGPPLLPVTGVDTVDDAIALTLQEQYEAHEATPPRPPEEAPGPRLRRTEFQEVAEAVLEQSVAAAQPKPPKLEPLDDLLPARVWTPVYEGCSPKFLEDRCNYQQPNPRLFVTNLNELMSARSLLQGQERQIEPTTLRQTHAQLLTMGWRSKKDPYSRASMTNDVAYGTCRAMAERTPEHVVF
ncbi:hypothetical protein EBX93_16265 [bacterium]|nr:hypothetical protein [bacterium]